MSDKDLAESIDQLMSEIPRRNRGEPTYKALELAWFYAELSYREFHAGKCSDCEDARLLVCGTCKQFKALEGRARMARL